MGMKPRERDGPQWGIMLLSSPSVAAVFCKGSDLCGLEINCSSERSLSLLFRCKPYNLLSNPIQVAEKQNEFFSSAPPAPVLCYVSQSRASAHMAPPLCSLFLVAIIFYSSGCMFPQARSSAATTLTCFPSRGRIRLCYSSLPPSLVFFN